MHRAEYVYTWTDTCIVRHMVSFSWLMASITAVKSGFGNMSHSRWTKGYFKGQKHPLCYSASALLLFHLAICGSQMSKLLQIVAFTLYFSKKKKNEWIVAVFSMGNVNFKGVCKGLYMWVSVCKQSIGLLSCVAVIEMSLLQQRSGNVKQFQGWMSRVIKKNLLVWNCCSLFSHKLMSY